MCPSSQARHYSRQIRRHYSVSGQIINYTINLKNIPPRIERYTHFFAGLSEAKGLEGPDYQIGCADIFIWLGCVKGFKQTSLVLCRYHVY